MQSQVKPLGVSLSPAQRERLKKLAVRKKRSSQWLAKEAISQYLDREEAAEGFRQETVGRWEEYCSTENGVPHEQILAWLDSWGTDSENEPPA